MIIAKEVTTYDQIYKSALITCDCLNLTPAKHPQDI